MDNTNKNINKNSNTNENKKINNKRGSEYKEQLEKLKDKNYIKELEKQGIKVVSVNDRDYPAKLLPYDHRPEYLFYKGRLPDRDKPVVAMVGARACSNYGRKMARALARELSENGVQIISGMARGIDTYSQIGALEGGTPTFAVLGSGVDVCYPTENIELYNDILKNHESMSVEDKNMFIEFTSKQLDRMEWLITTLLKYARIESNVVKYNKDTIPLKETIVNAIGPLRLKAEEKSQKIILNCHSQGYYLHDKKWMEEAISNIIKNAIEHTENNGIIDIKLEETPLSIGISIKDNGEGIKKDELRKIFNRFYKGENSLNPTSIGIGLSLSRKIIEAHNGTITVESQLNKGTTFYITFLKGII